MWMIFFVNEFFLFNYIIFVYRYEYDDEDPLALHFNMMHSLVGSGVIGAYIGIVYKHTCSTILYYVILYYTILCYTILYYTILYYTIL